MQTLSMENDSSSSMGPKDETKKHKRNDYSNEILFVSQKKVYNHWDWRK